jgi:hypothetical protein
MLNHANLKNMVVPVHGAGAGQEANVEQSEDEDCAEALSTQDDVIPRQIVPILFSWFERYNLYLQLWQTKEVVHLLSVARWTVKAPRSSCP